MADELQKINNPDSSPSALSTGWQQEIANTITQRNGLDCTAPVVSSATAIQLPAGGPVDVNGVLYSLTSVATLTIALTNTDYYIYLTAGSADHLTPVLTTNPGTFDASKNARYTAGGERILNWVVRRDASAAYVFEMDDPQDVDGLTGQDLRETADVTHRDGTFTGDVSVGDDLTVGDDAIITDLLTVGRATINGALLPNNSPTTGSYTLSAGGGTQVLSRGVWCFTGLTSLIYLQLYISGSWRNVGNSSMIFSDGSNVRLFNGDGGSAHTAYYQKY